MTRPLLGIAHRTRKSPFFDATRRWGAQAFTVYNHMLMPLTYESPEADYWHLVKGVTLWDVAVERQVEVGGPDAFELVRLMTPRDLSGCRPGAGKYIPLVDERGGMVNDPVLLPLAADRFWLSIADSDVLLWAKGLAAGRGLSVTLREPDVSPLALQGPRAEPVAAALCGEWVRALKYFHFRETDLDGIPLVVARSGWSKQGGFEFYLRDGRFGEELWERIMAAGRPWDIRPGAPSTIERIESGLLSYGNDMNLDTNPFEVGLGKYCHLDQPFDFIGRAALRRIRAEGVRRQLIGVVLSGERLPGLESHWPLLADGIAAGAVTSAVYSPRLRKNIGLALVERRLLEAESPLTAVTPAGERPVSRHALPFLPPQTDQTGGGQTSGRA